MFRLRTLTVAIAAAWLLGVDVGRNAVDAFVVVDRHVHAVHDLALPSSSTAMARRNDRTARQFNLPPIAVAGRTRETRLFIFAPSDAKKPSVVHSKQNDRLPYVVDRISKMAPNDSTFASIANLCIDVFFRELLGASPNDKLPPWKEVQFAYLKKLQTGDLKVRRKLRAYTNEMFMVYEIIPATGDDVLRKPLILDSDYVYNMPKDDAGVVNYVRGDLIGFAEITQRQYGLGAIDESDTLRPILANLAVAKHVRRFGIGSELLDLCENYVTRQWNMNEIVLEVEDYNTKALDFYARRGYEVLFTNPAGKRFDVSGFFLRKESCSREIMRKTLTLQRAQSASERISFNFFQKLRETVGV